MNNTQKTNSRKKFILNYVYNTSYRIFVLIVPLITTPYVSRVLEADGIGIYSYTYSIVSYFIIVSILGTAVYGNKVIGINQDNPQGRTEKFWNILSFRWIVCNIALVIYIIYSLFFSRYKVIALLQALNLFSYLFDISWFFQGMEDFKQIAVRNFVFKFINIACIFIFVREKTDLWKYVFLIGSLTVAGNVVNWPFAKKYLVSLKKFKPKPFENFGLIFQLFIPTAAMQVYAILDKTMIGAITRSEAQNGYYEQSEKIVKMSLMIVTSLLNVLFPKIAKAFAEHEYDKVRYYLKLNYKFVWFIALPLMVGTMTIASMLVPVFFGPGYLPVTPILQLMSMLFLVMGFNQTIGSQYFVANNKQNIYTKAILIGGIFNIICNALLIPRYKAFGAGIGTVFGEFAILLVILANIAKDKEFPLKLLINGVWRYFTAAVIMGSCVIISKRLFPTTVKGLFCCIIGGALSYFISLYLLRDDLTRKAIDMTLGKLQKQKQNKITK